MSKFEFSTAPEGTFRSLKQEGLFGSAADALGITEWVDAVSHLAGHQVSAEVAAKVKGQDVIDRVIRDSGLTNREAGTPTAAQRANFKAKREALQAANVEIPEATLAKITEILVDPEITSATMSNAIGFLDNLAEVQALLGTPVPNWPQTRSEQRQAADGNVVADLGNVADMEDGEAV